jgi:short-subunit dehydrogenase
VRSSDERRLRVVITGASSGVGAALAREYAKRGARLALIARRRGPLDSLAASLGADHAVYPVDVRDGSGLRAAARDAVARWDGVDVVIGNAGVSAGTLTERADDQPVVQEIMDVNVVGLFNTFQAFLPALLASGRGTLVGIASVAGFRGLPGSGAYSASKAAAIAYLESLRVELRGRGVRVLIISPGYIDTPMTRGNPYPMPFKLPAAEAARRIANAVASERRHVVIPWQMGVIGALLRVLPHPLYDALFARAPRKPRRSD